jgi:hypothetical protein
MDLRDRRFYAADWFMSAAAIPLSLVLAAVCAGGQAGSVTDFLAALFLIVAAPAVIAGGWGGVLGASILDPAATRGPGRAALRGTAVAAASFVTYTSVCSLLLGLVGYGGWGDGFKFFIVVLVYGGLFLGWLVTAVGAVAGALLYQRQEYHEAGRSS